MSKCYRKVFLKIGVVSLILIALLIPPEYLLLVNAQDMIDSPVTIDFKDTDIRDVLRTLSRQTGKSIVADPDVSGSVTIHLSDVGLEDGMRQVLPSLGFYLDDSSGIYRVRKLNSSADLIVEELNGKLRITSEGALLEQLLIKAANVTNISYIPVAKLNIPIYANLVDVTFEEALDYLFVGRNLQYTLANGVYIIEENIGSGAKAQLEIVNAKFSVKLNDGKIALVSNGAPLYDVLVASANLCNINFLPLTKLDTAVYANLSDVTFEQLLDTLLSEKSYQWQLLDGVYTIKYSLNKHLTSSNQDSPFLDVAKLAPGRFSIRSQGATIEQILHSAAEVTESNFVPLAELGGVAYFTFSDISFAELLEFLTNEKKLSYEYINGIYLVDKKSPEGTESQALIYDEVLHVHCENDIAWIYAYDVPLVELIHKLAIAGNINIIIDPSVSSIARMTLRGIQIEEALSYIATTHNLELVALERATYVMPAQHDIRILSNKFDTNRNDLVITVDENNLFEVLAQNVPLSSILSELTELTNASIYLLSEKDPLVSLHIDGKPLLETLKVIARASGFYLDVSERFYSFGDPVLTNLLDEPGIKVSMARNGNFSFSAENISIRKVLSEIAFFAGINLVIAPDVSGEVHVILNDVTWQSCLDTVLEIGNLEVIDKNGVLWVVPQINHFDGLTVNVVDELLLPKGIELLKYKDGLLSLNVQGVAISTLINELVNHLEDDSVLPTIVVQGDISNERIYGVIVNAPIISGLENLLFAHRLLLTRHDGQYFIERFPEQIPYLIQYSDGLLQIESTNAVLRNVLQEVALKTGVNFIIPEDLEHIISIELRNVVPQLAVEILLRGTGYKLEAYPDNQRGIEDWSGTFVFEPTIGSALADTDPIFAVSKQDDASVLSPGITVLEIDDAGIVAKFQDVLLHDLLSDIFLYGGPHFTTDLGLKNEKVSGEIRGEQVATSIRNFMHLQGYILIDLPEKTIVRSKNAGQPLVYFSEGLFYLDINNGDFNTIVREMANLCGEPIVIASQTKQTISSVQLYGVTFEQSLWYLLQGSSISFLKDDGVYIFGEGVQPQANLPNFTESEIFYLKHISPNQLLSVLPPTIPNANVKQITGRTAVVAFGATEMLERIAEFIELVDMPTPVTPELVPIIYANSEELVNVLARHYSQDMFQYIPTQQSVLLNSTTDKNQEIKNLIAVLDTSDARMVTEVISLDHIKAEDAREYMDPRLSDSSIVVLASQNALVVSGSKDYLNQVREYLASIDTRNPQVVFEVMIVEISNRVSGQLGISVATADNSIKYDLLSGSPFSMILNSGFLAEPALTATLNALVQEGNAKLLANPRLTVLNGNEASFNVLTTSRYWVPQTGGNMSDQEGENQNKNSTQAFRTIETGIRLRLKPWVSASGEITIELYPEISDSAGSSMGSSLPSTNDRSVSTTVRVKDGETIMIGGLLQRSEYKEVNQVPLLGQMPIIGRLFSSETTSEIETEFIITITSHLIDFWQ